MIPHLPHFMVCYRVQPLAPARAEVNCVAADPELVLAHQALAGARGHLRHDVRLAPGLK